MNLNNLRHALRAEPFRPFKIRLVDGRELEVPHREFVAIAHRLAIHIRPEDQFVTWIEPPLIVSIDFGPQAPNPPVRAERDNSE